MKKADICAGIIGIFIGCWVIYNGLSFPTDVVMKIGPSFFPDFLAGGLIIFSATLLIRAVIGHAVGSVEHWHWSDQGVRRGAITLAAAVVFCILIKPLGFILTSIAFLLFMMIILGRRKPLDMVWVPLTVTAGIWLIFEKLLNLDLPPGVLSGLLS